MCDKPFHFAIIGASLAGNKGAEAMLLTSIDNIRQRWPNSIIHVLSYLPEEDIRICEIPDVYIHSATPATLVFKWLPIALACSLIPKFRKKAQCTHNQSIVNLLNIHAAFDIFGVSFMDTRIKFLPFNILSLFPFISNGVPTFKLSQALGPFKKRINQVCANWTLNKMAFVAARGSKTKEMLEQLNIDAPSNKIIESADIAFLLKPYPPLTQRIEHEKTLAIIPSIVVDKKLPNYQNNLIHIAQTLHLAGWKIKIIVHSWRDDPEEKRHNDPAVALPLSKALYAKGIEAPLVGIGMNCVEIRDAIGGCTVVLTSRFHGMIAALTTARPVVVIGWSHKYAEVLEQFNLSQNAIPYSSFTPDVALKALLECDSKQLEISQSIAEKLPDARKSAEVQFNEAHRYLSQTP